MSQAEKANIRRISVFLPGMVILLLACRPAISAVFYSQQNGYWSSASTWGGTGIPGNGDTVTMNHQVTVDVNITVGHSPGTDDPVAAIRITSSGHLIIAAGVTLICHGDLRLQPGYVTLQAGSVLEMDSSQASSPLTSVYKIDIQPGAGNNNALLTVNGTAGTRCQIRANTAGAHAQIDDGNNTPNGGQMMANYCDFKRLGGSPDYQAWHFHPTGSGDMFRVQDCTFDQCSRISTRDFLNNACPAGTHVEFIRCSWTNSVCDPGGGYWGIYSAGAEYGAVTRIIQCRFDKIVYLGKPRDYEVEDCVFMEGIKAYSDNNGHKMKSFKRNFVRWITPTSIWNLTFGNTIEDCIFMKDVEDFNPHYATVMGGSGPLTIRGNVMWSTVKNFNYAEGDGFMLGRPSAGTRQENTILMEKNIMLPNGQGPDGYNNLSCTPFTILLGVTHPFQVVFKRNTVYAGSDYGGCNIGETEIAQAGDVAYFKSNLFVGTDHSGGSLAGRKLHNLGHAETDVILAENADYNAGFRLAPGDGYGNGSGKGYHRLTFSGSSVIGAHDIDDINPQFVDNTRTPATWDADLGGSGTIQGTMSRLAPGGGHSMQELLDYIREGFRPQNALLRGAGDPFESSPDIGAVNMDSPSMQTISLFEGWNWISFQVRPTILTLDSLFSNISNPIEQVKAQTQSAIRSSVTWIGDSGVMNGINQHRMFKVKVSSACTLTVTGIPIAPTSPIVLQTGWNWVAYLPTTALSPGVALDSIKNQVTELKSRSQSATYNGGSWSGNLTQMEPGQGYTIFMTAPGTLIYPASAKIWNHKKKNEGSVHE